MSGHFFWKDRRAAIRRIVVMMTCIEGMTIDKAVEVVFSEEHSFKYCGLASKVSPVVVEKLKKDARAALLLPNERLVEV